eukprot:TRINITY_DN68966_c0_g1_i1.p1 TRINITY_DN68966_c0_g1~~TRINITY_DN68966_c0_g1_i1.p1  ORF type:complete len:435 (+),score=63.59 TRINITY_DN68966_c0_g1_i1:56-1360(+)
MSRDPKIVARAFISPFPRPLDAATLQENITGLADKVAAQHVDTHNPQVYTGASGVAYALIRVGRAEQASPHIDAALKWASRHPAERDSHAAAVPGGHAGIFFTAALHAMALKDFKAASQHCQSFFSLARAASQNPSPEWLYGRAGYLTAAVELAAAARAVKLEGVVPDGVIQPLWEGLLMEGIRQRWRYVWHRKEYVGAAHGTLGVLHALLLCPDLCRSATHRQNIIDGLETVASWAHGRGGPRPDSPCATCASQSRSGGEQSCPEDGNWPAAFGDATASLVHFCHGAPGAVLLFGRAHEVLGSNAVLFRDTPSEVTCLDTALAAADVVLAFGRLRKGPGSCHGVGGNGHVLASLAAKMPADDRRARTLWDAAGGFGAFLFEREFRDGAHTPDAPWSLFEGWAGALVFLHDLARRRVAFPVFEPEWTADLAPKD